MQKETKDGLLLGYIAHLRPVLVQPRVFHSFLHVLQSNSSIFFPLLVKGDIQHVDNASPRFNKCIFFMDVQECCLNKSRGNSTFDANTKARSILSHTFDFICVPEYL